MAAAGNPRVGRPGPTELVATVRYKDGSVSGTVVDRDAHIGSDVIKLSEPRLFQFGEKPRAVAWNGRAFDGRVADLDTIKVRVGGQTVVVNLGDRNEGRGGTSTRHRLRAAMRTKSGPFVRKNPAQFALLLR
jgi:hypothetical protein